MQVCLFNHYLIAFLLFCIIESLNHFMFYFIFKILIWQINIFENCLGLKLKIPIKHEFKGRTYISFCYKLAGGCLYCASRTASFGYNYHQSFIITEKIVLSSARPFYISPLMLNKLLVSTTSLDKCKFSVSHPLFLYLTFYCCVGAFCSVKCCLQLQLSECKKPTPT